MTSRTQGERLAAVEQRIADHESRCEERLFEIKADGAATRATVEKLQGFVVSLIVAVCGFALMTLTGIMLVRAGLGS
jgi:hypothetical protein